MPSCITPVNLHLVFLLVSLKSRVHNSFICVHFPLIIVPVPSIFANQFFNRILSTYNFHYIIIYGIYLVIEHVFLWSYVSICGVLNYYWWPIIFKSNLLLGFHSWREYEAYPIILNCVQNKGSIFGVAFGRIISCFPTEITRIWIIPPGYEFLSRKVSCWNP